MNYILAFDLSLSNTGVSVFTNDGEYIEMTLSQEEIGMPLPNLEPLKTYYIKENKNGLHQLGGEIPLDFKIPENECVVPFQYLGFINNMDPNFNWLPFKFHLICPVYLNFPVMILDYSNPLEPIILNKEDLEESDTSFDDYVDSNSEFIYEEMKFNFVETEGFGNAGIPNWFQYPSIPICPKTGNCMKFLCLLNDGITVDIKYTNISIPDDYYKNYFENLNYWGDGNLYVFFEPTSKIACYFIQIN